MQSDKVNLSHLSLTQKLRQLDFAVDRKRYTQIDASTLVLGQLSNFESMGPRSSKWMGRTFSTLSVCAEA